MELGRILIYLFSEKSRYLKWFNFPIERGTTRNFNLLRFNVRKKLRFEIRTPQVNLPNSPPTLATRTVYIFIPLTIGIGSCLDECSGPNDI